MHEAIFKDFLFKNRNASSGRQGRHHLRLKVGWKAREGFGYDVDGLDAVAATTNQEASLCFTYIDTGGIKPF